MASKELLEARVMLESVEKMIKMQTLALMVTVEERKTLAPHARAKNPLV